MEIRTLHPDEFEQWTRHCGQVFKDTPAEYFDRHFMNDPDRDFDGVFVAVDNGRILSTVRAFRRAVYLSGNIVTMGGIGEVSTQPEYRRMGLSTQLLARAQDYFAAQDLHLSFLFTGTNHHYARSGWHTVVTRGLSVVHIDADAVPIRAFTPDDLPSLRGIYALSAPQFDGMILRSRAYWDAWVSQEMKHGIVHEGENGIDAYIACGANAAHVSECLAAPGAEKWLPGMLKSFMADKNIDTGNTHAAFFDGLPGLSQARHTESTEIMVRLISPFMLAGEKIADPLSVKRLCADLTFSGIDGF